MAILPYLRRIVTGKDALANTLLWTAWLAHFIQIVIFGLFFATLRIAHLNTTTGWPQLHYLLKTVPYLSCTAHSLLRQYWKTRSGASSTASPMRGYLEAPGPGQAAWWWRQTLLSGVVGVWALLSGIYLPPLTKEDEDSLRDSPWIFVSSFAFTLTTCASIRLLPVIAVNTIPRSSYRIARIQNVTIHKIPGPLSAKPYFTDIMGLVPFTYPFWLAIVALIDKEAPYFNGAHQSSGLESRYKYPIHYIDYVVWGAIALMAGGVLVRKRALKGLGLPEGWVGRLLIVVLCAASPLSVALGY